jgi:hypothetical protein
MTAKQGPPEIPADPEARALGRPKLGRPRRIRITTTIEPAKLALLREHARRVRKSLGQLADEYVSQWFGEALDLHEE